MIAKRKITAFVIILLMILTVWGGYALLKDQKYYFISFLLIVEALGLLLLLFENRKAKTSEILTISVMAALSAMSRVVFYAVPEIKPMLSLVILSGIVFGKESGLMIGMLRKFCLQFFLWARPLDPLADVCIRLNRLFGRSGL